MIENNPPLFRASLSHLSKKDRGFLIALSNRLKRSEAHNENGLHYKRDCEFDRLLHTIRVAWPREYPAILERVMETGYEPGGRVMKRKGASRKIQTSVF